jgi:hypothetical protein
MVVRRDLNKNFLFSAIAGLIVVSLLFMPLAAGNLWWREVFNSGHTILFLFISFVLYLRLSATSRFSNSVIIYLVVLVVVLMLGIAIEMLQGLLQRETSVDDLYRNFFGIISGLGLVSLRRQKILSNKILVLIFSLSFLLLGTCSLFQISWHYVQRVNAFPVILDFNADWSDSFVRFNRAEMVVSSGKAGDKNRLFRIRFDAGSFPGVSIIEPAPDWSAYRNLRFKVASGHDENIDLFLRIHDKNHDQNYQDRFNKKLIIHPGLNEIVISLAQIEKGPLKRDLDLTNIAGLILFLSKVKKPQLLEISNIYLD